MYRRFRKSNAQIFTTCCVQKITGAKWTQWKSDKNTAAVATNEVKSVNIRSYTSRYWRSVASLKILI